MKHLKLPPLALKSIANLMLLCVVAPLAAIVSIFVPGKTGKLLQAFFWSLPMFGNLYILGCALAEHHRMERERQ